MNNAYFSFGIIIGVLLTLGFQYLFDRLYEFWIADRGYKKVVDLISLDKTNRRLPR